MAQKKYEIAFNRNGMTYWGADTLAEAIKKYKIIRRKYPDNPVELRKHNYKFGIFQEGNWKVIKHANN